MPIELNNLVCYANEIAICKPITLSLQDGCLVILEGANGAGKSTILRSLAGLITNVTGKIILKGSLCYVGHEIVLHENLNVSQNLYNIFSLEERTAGPALLTQRVKSALAKLGLAHKARAFAWQLSKGQQHKLNLAKLFFSQQPIWLLDEPLVHLDLASQALVLELIQEHLNKPGSVVVLSSHTPIKLAHVELVTLKVV